MNEILQQLGNGSFWMQFDSPRTIKTEKATVTIPEVVSGKIVTADTTKITFDPKSRPVAKVNAFMSATIDSVEISDDKVFAHCQTGVFGIDFVQVVS